MSILKKAEHKIAFFKCGILGFQGSGKTYTATLFAIGISKLINNNKVAYLDTETGSDFLLSMLRKNNIEVFTVKERSFTTLLQFIKDCEADKIGVGIIDSITHIWRDLCDSYDAKLRRKGRLQFQDWNIIKGEWKQYTDAFVNSKLHLIVCGRAGYEYDYDYNPDGTKDLIKVGTKMKVESEFGFEPSLVIEMERLTKDKDEISKIENRDKKQSFKSKIGSQWIHRAHILKDRTDNLNGQKFDYPTFDNFLPHFQALNIGGEHLGVDTSKTSEDRFDNEGKPEWKKDKDLAVIELEEIEGLMTKYFPSTSGREKQAKLTLIEYVFGTRSWAKVQSLKLAELKIGRKRMAKILENEDNLKILLNEEQGKIIEPEIIEEPKQTEYQYIDKQEITIIKSYQETLKKVSGNDDTFFIVMNKFNYADVEKIHKDKFTEITAELDYIIKSMRETKKPKIEGSLF